MGFSATAPFKPTQIDTENADRDLTSTVTVLTHTPSTTEWTWCMGHVDFGDGTKDLDASGGNFELTVIVGSQVYEPGPQTVAFGTNARACIDTAPILVPPNTAIVLRAKSPNGADTDVDVTAYLLRLE